MDGVGYREDSEGNAVASAKKPTLDRLFSDYPWTTLACHGRDVGLAKGVMGNSEVGHLNIGAGRIVKQELVHISDEIEEGAFFKNGVLNGFFDRAAERGRLHIGGLISDGCVHAANEHLYALLDLAKRKKITNVFLHCFMDGRDSSPHDGKQFIGEVMEACKKKGIGSVATLIGRYYVMDRDKRWERNRKAYDLFVNGVGERSSSPTDAIENSYRAGITDEFMEPVLIDPDAVLKEGDCFFFFNFRADRVRQITKILGTALYPELGFREFDVSKCPKVEIATLTAYEHDYPFPAAYPPQKLEGILADVMAQHNLRNVRAAETEKYAHVTYFFNGGVEEPYLGEDRILVPSPKVKTYDLKPEMSAYEVTEKLLKYLETTNADVGIVNFANGDMVGHTGVFDAAVEAIEVIDACVGRLLELCERQKRVAIVTADHGNSECLLDENGNPMTAHTLNPVPLFIFGEDYKGRQGLLRKGGRLADISPTLLHMMGLAPSPQMTGKSLIS